MLDKLVLYNILMPDIPDKPVLHNNVSPDFPDRLVLQTKKQIPKKVKRIAVYKDRNTEKAPSIHWE